MSSTYLRGKGSTRLGKDGFEWEKSTHNPVFGPEPANEWDFHYTTSESVIRLADGSYRMWYASRTKPPFVHKYLAIGTARLTCRAE